MDIILTNAESCQSLAYKDGCYYMQFKPNGKFIEIKNASGNTCSSTQEKVTAQFIEAAKGNENKFLKTMSRENNNDCLRPRRSKYFYNISCAIGEL